jgi:hypothetical protein
MRKSSVWTNFIVIVFLSMFVLGCNKDDKVSVLGTWEINIKEVKPGFAEYEYARETMVFSSGGKYSQTYEEKLPKQVKKTETFNGDVEREKGKITFKNRMKNGIEKQPDVTFPYRLEANAEKLIIIMEGFGFPKDEKVYIKTSSSL